MLRWIGAAVAIVGLATSVRADEIAQPPGFKGKIAREGSNSVPYWPPETHAPPGAPNILIWVIDDAGFGQSSAYGGLVNTPTLERLAAHGLRYTNFNATALCSPSRAALLTGRNHHAVGVGTHISREAGYPGYDGRIPPSAATLARILQMNGYTTFAAGKWDILPGEFATVAGPFDDWPSGKGFDHYYGFLKGESPQFQPEMWADHTPLDPSVNKPDYFLTTDLANKAIEWITAQKSAAPTQPFFLYWATGAVHSPHQAPPDYIAKYKGHFDMGWDKARELVLARQKQLGLMPADTQLPERLKEIPAWDSLSADEKRIDAREMEVFAAQFEQADAQFGRILDTLQRTGQLDNTIVIVLSDNGASAEGAIHGTFNENTSLAGNFATTANNLRHYDAWGSAKVHGHYAAGWALAGNTPFNYYKQTVYGGGVRVPFIVSWPDRIKQPGIRTQFQYVNDVMPTLLSVVGVKPPETVDGVPQQRIDGVDMSNTFFDANSPTRKTVQYFEMFGSRGIWQNGWKAATLSTTTPWDMVTPRDLSDDHWQLFHVDADFNERIDVAAQYPEKLAELRKLFEQEAIRNNVYPLWPSGTERLSAIYKETVSVNKGHYVYYTPGAYRISTEVAPPFASHSHKISAEIDIPPSGAEGIILAYGGHTGGFAFYIQDGKLTYTSNALGDYLGDGTVTVQGPRMTPGKHRVALAFDMTGKGSGRAQLLVDGAVVAQQDIAKVFNPVTTDTLDIGFDGGTPVTDAYKLPFAFTGGLNEVDVDIAP